MKRDQAGERGLPAALPQGRTRGVWVGEGGAAAPLAPGAWETAGEGRLAFGVCWIAVCVADSSVCVGYRPPVSDTVRRVPSGRGSASPGWGAFAPCLQKNKSCLVSKLPIQLLFFCRHTAQCLYHVRLQHFQNFVGVVFCVDVQVDRLG